MSAVLPPIVPISMLRRYGDHASMRRCRATCIGGTVVPIDQASTCAGAGYATELTAASCSRV
jgi:hypothetical protein